MKSGLKKILIVGATILALGGGLACNKQIEEKLNYEVVSLEEVKQGENPLELCITPNSDGNWNYEAGHKQCGHIALGFGSLSDLVNGVKEDVLGRYDGFTGIIIHTHDLTEEQRQQVANELGIPNVAYFEKRRGIEKSD